MAVADLRSRLRASAYRILKPPETVTVQAFKRLSLRSLFVYLGPSLIVSMAYMDPGNYGTDITSGAKFGYNLLWAVWAANLMAMVLQYLSGKLGIATGRSLPELVRDSLSSRRPTIPVPALRAYFALLVARYLGHESIRRIIPQPIHHIVRVLVRLRRRKLAFASGRTEHVKDSLNSRRLTIPYWLGAEVAAAATDLAEYLGTVIALNILFQIPLIYAAILGALDVIILLALTKERFRIIEYFFMVFVSIIGIGFLYQVILIQPSLSSIAYHSVAPSVNSETILFVVGIVGATVMPHALFVHSWLTKNKLTSATIEEKRKHRRLHLREVILTLTIASLVNAAILVSAAKAFYPSDISTITQAYGRLVPLYGSLAAAAFAITLLASGLASSTTGTLAGQAIMDGLLGTHVNKNLRRIVTRVINVFPTTAALLIGLDPLSLLVYSQVMLSLMIPLPMIPLIVYTRRKALMGEFVNRRITTLLAGVSAGSILALNIMLLVTSF